MKVTMRRGHTMARAISSDVQAKLDLLIEAAVARGRVRGPDTLRELDLAAIAYYRVAKQENMEREHADGLCNGSCPICARAQEQEEMEESA